MRFKLRLALTGPGRTLPLPYNLQQAGLIYDILARSSPSYAKFLHEIGYQFAGKKYKLFTYSYFRVPERRIENRKLICLTNIIDWYISSPKEEFQFHFMQGLCRQSTFMLDAIALRLHDLEHVPEPEFLNEMRFRLLSPVTVAKPVAGSKHAHYIRPWETGAFSEAVGNNLANKYEALTGGPPADNRLEFVFDCDWTETKKHEISKLIQIHQVSVKAFEAPFTVRGSRELIRLGYQCGFGNQNSMGCGMAAPAPQVRK